MKSPARKMSFLAVLSVVLLLGASFLAPQARAIDLSGTWTGSWASDRGRHHGPMTAGLCKIDEQSYAATFRGRFFGIMPFKYSTVLNVDEDGDVVKLSGSSYLGRMFGTFTFAATATATDLNATYSSCKDWGHFCFTRCCTACAK